MLVVGGDLGEGDWVDLPDAAPVIKAEPRSRADIVILLEQMFKILFNFFHSK